MKRSSQFLARKPARVRTVPLGRHRDVARRFKDPIFSGTGLDDESATLLKAQPSHLIQHVFKLSPIEKHKLIGVPFPHDFKQIRVRRPTVPSEELAAEIKWQISAFLAFADRLNAWLLQKQLFETAFLTGEYPTAHDVVARASDVTGKSLWELELRLLLAQVSTGLEANRELLRELSSEVSNWGNYLLPHFSHRAEPTFSLEEYENYIIPLLAEDTEDSPAIRAIQNLLAYRLLPSKRLSHNVSPIHFNLEESHALIDRFQFFCWSFEKILSDKFPDVPEEWASAVFACREKINSPRIDHYCNLLAFEDQAAASNGEMFRALHNYTIGNYEDCLRDSLQLLKANPTVIEPYELVAKCFSYLGRENFKSPFKDDCIATQILSSLASVTNRDHAARESITQISRLGMQLDSFPLGAQLRAFANSQRKDVLALRLDKFIASASAFVTPRCYVSLCNGPSVLPYLRRMALHYPHNAAIGLFVNDQSALYTGASSNALADVPACRTERHNAYILEKLGLHKKALDVYSRLRKGYLSASEASDVTAGAYRCHTALGDVLEASKLVVASVLSATHSVGEHTITELANKQLAAPKPTRPQGISLPLIIAIAQERRYIPWDTGQLHDALDDFLSSWDIQRPMELQPLASQFDLPELIYFLRFLCEPSVLEESIWYGNQHEVEHERILICEWLVKIDATNRMEYQEEIALLNRAAAIRQFTNTAERARIYVDTAAITMQLPQSVKDRAVRCMTLAAINDERYRNTLEMVGLSLDKLEDKAEILYVDEGFRLFKSVFEEIQSRFVTSNQYGLDANLSQRIRHGTLAGAIRAPFESFNLVTSKREGKYLPNKHWLERLELRDTDEFSDCSKAFSELSRAVDEAIFVVRNEWIQIRSQSKPKGHFEFDFDGYELNALYPVATRHGDLKLLLSTAYQSLWTKTEASLKNVRQAIKGELNKQLFDALDIAECSIVRSIHSDRAQGLRGTITLCRTQLTGALDAIVEWLQIDEHEQIPDFNFETFVGALCGVIGDCNRAYRVSPSVTVVGDPIVPGKYFRGIWDILIILMDNAIKYAGLTKLDVKLNFRMTGDGFILSVQNRVADLMSKANMHGAILTINALNSAEADLELSRTEGGSGYTKIHKILRFDLGAKSHRVEARIEEDIFETTITAKAPWRV